MSDGRPREEKIRDVEAGNQQKGRDGCKKNAPGRANVSAHDVFQEDEPEMDFFVTILGSQPLLDDCHVLCRPCEADFRLQARDDLIHRIRTVIRENHRRPEVPLTRELELDRHHAKHSERRPIQLNCLSNNVRA